MGYLPRPSEQNLVPTRSKAKRIPHGDTINQLLIITNNPNGGHFSERVLRRVEYDPVAPLALGPVKCNIRAFDQALRRVRMAFIEGHTGGHGNR